MTESHGRWLVRQILPDMPPRGWSDDRSCRIEDGGLPTHIARDRLTTCVDLVLVDASHV
jgi:hypothetical protein